MIYHVPVPVPVVMGSPLTSEETEVSQKMTSTYDLAVPFLGNFPVGCVQSISPTAASFPGQNQTLCLSLGMKIIQVSWCKVTELA